MPICKKKISKGFVLSLGFLMSLCENIRRARLIPSKQFMLAFLLCFLNPIGLGFLSSNLVFLNILHHQMAQCFKAHSRIQFQSIAVVRHNTQGDLLIAHLLYFRLEHF